MRPAMAMIELIFAIVIIAISVITIPVMTNIADKSTKNMAIDEDVMSRLTGWTIDKFQARWDANYASSGSRPLSMNPDAGDLNCNRGGMYRLGSIDTPYSMQCDMAVHPSAIPALGSGNLANGIEQLNGGSETITITPTTGAPYAIKATYSVRYVTSTVAANGGNAQTAIWVLGSSSNMAPDGATDNPTHLKRVVTRFHDATLGVDTTLTFFKSNKGN